MSTINISPRDLEAILAVAEHGSFRAAADALKLTQPSVSSRVQHAEDVLGVKLFHRTTRKVTITEQGERLCLRANHVMAEMSAVVKELRDEARLERGRVVIGATPTIACSLLPGILQQFTKRWPGVEVVLRDDFSRNILDRLISIDVDVALMPLAKEDPRFNFETLFFEEVLLLAPQDHPAILNRTTNLTDLVKYPILTFPTGTAIRTLLNSAFNAEGLLFTPNLETHHCLSLFAMVTAGFGISFVPANMVNRSKMDSLTVARIGTKGLYRPISLVTTKGRAIQPATKALMKALRSSLKERVPIAEAEGAAN